MKSNKEFVMLSGGPYSNQKILLERGSTETLEFKAKGQRGKYIKTEKLSFSSFSSKSVIVYDWIESSIFDNNIIFLQKKY